MKPETPELIEVSSDSDSNDGHVDDDEDDQPDNRSVELLTLARLRGSSASVAESQPTKKSKGVAGKKPNGPPTGTLPRAKAAAEGSSSEQKKARKRSAKEETGLTKEPKLNSPSVCTPTLPSVWHCGTSESLTARLRGDCHDAEVSRILVPATTLTIPPGKPSNPSIFF